MEIDHAPRGAERRRAPRTTARRAATFMLLNHPERGWGSGKIADVSRTGAGLVLFGPPWPRYGSELRLLVRLQANGAADRNVAPLEVMIRNTTATGEGWLRVGVEFVAGDTDQLSTATKWMRVLTSDS